MSWLESVFRINQQQELFNLSLQVNFSNHRKLSSVFSWPPVLIAEFKRTTPDRRLTARGSPEQFARLYQESPFVSAVSVVVEPVFFKTTLDDLQIVRRMVTKPLLAKGFFSCSWQLEKLRLSGADAVLLIATFLKKKELHLLLEFAEHAGLEVVIEVHDPDELKKLNGLNFPVLLVNNRNLKTLQIDPVRAMRTILKIKSEFPDRRLIVASGLNRGSDLLNFICFQPDAFLVGGALLSSVNPESVLEDLGRAIHDDFD